MRCGPALRAAVVLGALSCALVPVRAADPLGPDRARRLLTRVGFAPSPAEVAAWADLPHAAAVDRLLAGGDSRAATPDPWWVDEKPVPPRQLRAQDEAGRRARQAQFRYALQLRGWWLQEMASSPDPLTERMTLFWHNHFVSAQPKVPYAQLMYRQNVLLRRHALGNFRSLLHAVARDPAMLIYLDTAVNRRDAPNENFAREVMELFTLGEGNYAESDVKEAARAFSGWSLDTERLTFVFRPRLHDAGVKTVLGRTGAWSGDDVLDILLEQPAAAGFIVRKLWREFVSPEPDPARVRPIAQRFRASGYEIRTVLRELLMQPELVARDEDNALVKSPVELAIGLVRQSGGRIEHPVALAVQLAAMGQNLFAPPNVRGWPGGTAWITSQSLLARKQFLAAAVRPGDGAPAGFAPAAVMTEPAQDPLERRRAAIEALGRLHALRIDVAHWLRPAGAAAEVTIGEQGATNLARLLLVLPASGAIPADALGADALRAVLLDPVYQLK
jgi:uncharacterized protein (DUF1800 family)